MYEYWCVKWAPQKVIVTCSTVKVHISPPSVWVRGLTKKENETSSQKTMSRSVSSGCCFCMQFLFSIKINKLENNIFCSIKEFDWKLLSVSLLCCWWFPQQSAPSFKHRSAIELVFYGSRLFCAYSKSCSKTKVNTTHSQNERASERFCTHSQSQRGSQPATVCRSSADRAPSAPAFLVPPVSTWAVSAARSSH